MDSVVLIFFGINAIPMQTKWMMALVLFSFTESERMPAHRTQAHGYSLISHQLNLLILILNTDGWYDWLSTSVGLHLFTKMLKQTQANSHWCQQRLLTQITNHTMLPMLTTNSKMPWLERKGKMVCLQGSCTFYTIN